MALPPPLTVVVPRLMETESNSTAGARPKENSSADGTTSVTVLQADGVRRRVERGEELATFQDFDARCTPASGRIGPIRSSP